MLIKKLFLLICLLSTTILGANNIPFCTATSVSQATGGPGCNLPAPFGFHVDAIGATWITMGWGGNVMYEHRVRMYRASDNTLLSTTIVPAGILTATVSIPFNTGVKAVINAICLDGSHSPNNYESPVLHGFILNLEVVGYQGAGNSSLCHFIDQGSCTFTNRTTFMISVNGQNERNFDVEPTVILGRPTLVFYPQDPNTGDEGTYSYYCNTQTEGPCSAAQLTIKYWQGPDDEDEITVAILEATQTYGSGTTNILSATLYHDDIHNIHYRIDKLSPATGFGPSSGAADSRNENSISPERLATASPNPFSESLEVFPGHKNAEKIKLQLFNLGGQKVIDQEFQGGNEQYSITTHGMAPGFYLLRIEADGEVQTLKVIKSE